MRSEVSSTEVLVVNFGEKEIDYALKILDILHDLGMSEANYILMLSKLKKQMSYADSKKIPYIIIAGEDEIKNNSCNN